MNNDLLQLATVPAALALLVAGVLVDHLSAGWAMGAFTVGMSVRTLVASILPGLRSASRDLAGGPAPDAA